MKRGGAAAGGAGGRGGDGDGAELSTVRARLAAIGVAPLRHEAVIADFASDPPLGRALAETAIAHADRIVAGVGAAMMAARAKRGAVVVRDAAAHKALRKAAGALEAKALEIVRLPEVWPVVGLDREIGWRHAWVLGADELLRIEATALARPPVGARVTVAGAVASPVTMLAGDRTVEALVQAAGGASTAPWLALDGGAWGGRLADPEEPPRSTLVLVLPAHHALVRRARLPVASQLRRVASACAGCRACTDVCPPFLDGRPLHPQRILAALASNRDARGETAAASACIGCGVCTAACPSGLDPAGIVRAVKAKLPADLEPPRRGRPHPDRKGRRLGIELLLLRAGLGD